MGVMAGGTLRMRPGAVRGKRRAGVLLAGLMVCAAVWERTEVLLFLAGHLLALWDWGDTQGHLHRAREGGGAVDGSDEQGSGRGAGERVGGGGGGGEDEEESKEAGGGGPFLSPSFPMLPSGNTSCSFSSSSSSTSSPLIHTTAFLVALYLLSYPDKHAAYTRGFRTLAALNLVRKETWHSLGAMLLVWSLGPCCCWRPAPSQSRSRSRSARPASLARAILLSDMVQYLGHISLALYLVHEPVLQLWGWWLTGWLLDAGTEEAAARSSSSMSSAAAAAAAVPALFVASSTVTGGVIYVADWFWRCVDVPCARVAQALYLWALQEVEDS